MADWKTQVTYNYSPSYHTYAYSLVYQAGTEQNHVNTWNESGISDSYPQGTAQSYYTAPRNRDQSPAGGSERHAVNGHCYPAGPGVVYLGDAQTGRLLLAGKPSGEARRPGSDSASDSESHTSPDSWSSGSSREGSLPQADPSTWVEKDGDAAAVGQSPVGSEDVSSSLMEEPQNFAVTGSEVPNNPAHFPGSPAAPKKQLAPVNQRGKVRSAFSEMQMNALVQRFSVQRYLTPAEMKNMAEMIGLTYKQVKTWFQNRRMKLRRHQKDTSWISERYTVNKDNAAHGAMFSNVPHAQPYQGEGQPQLREHYNQHMMKTAFKKNPQNLAFYLAAMGGDRSAGYPPWPSSSPQVATPSRSQVTGWSVSPSGGRYDYAPCRFNSPAAANVNNFGHNAGFETEEPGRNTGHCEQERQ